MVSPYRYHEISESTRRVLNPISLEKLLLLGDICGVGPGTRVLDLACGKGEMLCRFAERGATGVGVDLYGPFLEIARERADRLGVGGRLEFIEGDAAKPPGVTGTFGVAACIGATWIGGGLAGTLALLADWLAQGGWVLVGEPYWAEQPSEGLRSDFESRQDFADLAGTLDRFEEAGFDLVEMVLASHDDWDRYAASQWLNVADWLRAHPADPDASAMRQENAASRRSYLAEQRRCLGWGVFVLREVS